MPERILTQPETAQVALGGAVATTSTIAADNVPQCTQALLDSSPCWMDWLWGLLPWSQLGTIFGLAWITINIVLLVKKQKK